MTRSIWAKRIFLILVIGPLAILAFGFIVMFLWNNTLAPIFQISQITFWQGLGILVLAKIFFGGFGSDKGSRRSYRKQKMMWQHMTPEQREQFKQEWRNRRWAGN